MIRALRKYWREIRAWVHAQERGPRVRFLSSRWGNVRFVRTPSGKIIRTTPKKLNRILRAAK